MSIAVMLKSLLEQYMAGVVEFEPVSNARVIQMNYRYLERKERIVIV
jgi:hypothetical protein